MTAPTRPIDGPRPRPRPRPRPDRVTEVARRQTPPRRGRLGRALTGGLIVFGAGLFAIGRIGAATGWMYTSFDPHHLISQIIGAVLLLAGLTRLR